MSGSLEALTSAITALQLPKTATKILHAGVGPVTESDVQLASIPTVTSQDPATIIAFNVPHRSVAKLLEQNKVPCIQGTVIYKILDDIRHLLGELVEPTFRTEVLGKAEIVQVFTLSNGHRVAGSRVLDGQLQKASTVIVERGPTEVFRGIFFQSLIGEHLIELKKKRSHGHTQSLQGKRA